MKNSTNVVICLGTEPITFVIAINKTIKLKKAL